MMEYTFNTPADAVRFYRESWPFEAATFVILQPSADPLTEGVSPLVAGRLADLEQRIFHERSCGRTSRNKHGPIAPWQWAELNLKRDKDTREAVIPITIPREMYFRKNGVLPHCQYLQFAIDAGTLRLAVVYRVCDVATDLLFDLPYFCGLLPRMQAALASHHPNLQTGAVAVFAGRLYTSG